MKADDAAPLRTQDSALSTQHFRVVFGLSVLVALTRLLSLSRSLWDWDEALFCLALRDYNVVLHHPHPPGFPLFVGVAKLVRLVAGDDFLALRAVSLVAACFVFPALYALGRALRFEFRTAVVAALIFSFLPNVWYWGGTAFSDVFALVLFLAGAALLLRGDRRLLGSALFAGTLLVRPQNVLMAYPWFVASWRRVRAGRLREAVASAALIVMLVAGGYALAARATGGWAPYIKAVREHQHYIATTDGPLNPRRPSPASMFYTFAVDPFQGRRASYLLPVFFVAAFIRPRRRHLDTILTFAPNFLFTWLMLSVTGASRLSIAYLPMHALLAADGISALARSRAAIEAALASVLVALYVVWIWPALAEVRAHESPPYAAAQWARQHATGRVYVQGAMVPFADYYLAEHKPQEVGDDFDPTAVPDEPGAVYLADHELRVPGAANFVRPRRRLWALFNQRYFESSATPVAGGPHWIPGKIDFAEGWYAPEIDAEGHPFRWMGKRGRMVLGPLGRRGEVSMQFYAPLDAEAAPLVTIVFNDTVLESFRPDNAYFRRAYELDAAGELVITVDRVVNPSRLGKGDDRDLGLRVSAVAWSALER